MGVDSISNAAVPGFFKELSRKKKTNRLAKLKQSKLDVRREQWLSQVKSKEGKVDSNGRGGSPVSSLLVTDKGNRPPESLEVRYKWTDFENLDSSMNCPVFSSESSKCCSESVSDGEGDDDDCLDDWEAIADALMASEKQHITNTEPPAEFKADPQVDDPESCHKSSGVGLLEMENKEVVSRFQENCRAWRSDDVLRPRCLPNLLKPLSVTMNSTCKAVNRAWQSIVSQPTSCPICYEDLDLTDSSFLPCPCEFRLCLFCHKRILEADARCPGCRKQYDPKMGM